MRIQRVLSDMTREARETQEQWATERGIVNEFGLLIQVCKTLEEIATAIRPENDCPDTTKAQMAGLAHGFSDMLTNILDDEDLDMMKRARKLRELADRAKALGNQYSQDQAELDQKYVSHKQRVKNSIWGTGDN